MVNNELAAALKQIEQVHLTFVSFEEIRFIDL
jgi:hypothetical protein